MMVRGHLLTGASAGVVVAAVLPVPAAVRVGTGVLTAVCVLLPDIDSRRATITRLLGPLGLVLHHLTVAVGKALYDRTATAHDPDTPGTGHRLVSHTLVAAVGTGLLTAAGTAGMAALSPDLSTPWGRLAAGIGAWWWAWGLAVGIGHAVGVLGDTLTVAGAPIWWPLLVEGQRWYLVRSVLPFRAGRWTERTLVYPLLYVVLGVTIVSVMGWWPPIAQAAVRVVEAMSA